METFSALLAICAGNSSVPGEFPAQKPVTRSFDIFFDLRLNKRLSKQSWGWWFETLSCPLWRHSNAMPYVLAIILDINLIVPGQCQLDNELNDFFLACLRLALLTQTIIKLCWLVAMNCIICASIYIYLFKIYRPPPPLCSEIASFLKVLPTTITCLANNLHTVA